jgi:hypothetical protein
MKITFSNIKKSKTISKKTLLMAFSAIATLINYKVFL